MKTNTFKFCLIVISAFTATAQTQQPPPYALLQQATLTGSGNTINATWIPVVTTSGVAYVNATIQFSVDPKGNLTVSPGFPQLTLAPSIIVSNFKAGHYVGPSTILGGKTAIDIAGPGITSGGATMWTLSASPGADPNTFPSSGAWYVGPISNNPVAARINKVGITTTSLSYGVGGSQGGSLQGQDYGRWQENTLIGVSQVNNTITFYSFTYGTDSITPYSQITYTLAPGP